MITYLRGDATDPQAKGPKLIAHVCNDIGGWGRGFVLALSARWREPEAAYRRWYNDRTADGTTGRFARGEVQVVEVRHDIAVANMVAQEGVKTGSKGPPIRYLDLEKCLRYVNLAARLRKATVHMPRIGCGLAGGRWELVEPLINRQVVDAPVFVYDY